MRLITTIGIGALVGAAITVPTSVAVYQTLRLKQALDDAKEMRAVVDDLEEQSRVLVVRSDRVVTDQHDLKRQYDEMLAQRGIRAALASNPIADRKFRGRGGPR